MLKVGEDLRKFGQKKSGKSSPKPSFVEFYIVYVSSFFKYPFGIIIQQLTLAKKVRYYEREMKLIFDKWNLEKIKKNN